MRIHRAVVTGASSGIGRAIALELARRGTGVVLVARDEERLEVLADQLRDVHGVDADVLAADLADDGDRRSVEQRLADRPTVDCLVNNAGLGTYGPLAASSADAEQSQVEVNVTALVRLTQVAAMTFRARRHGAILNVSSVAGFQPSPGHATYGATKAFVTALTEAVHEELRGSGVHVTALCPGYTHTEFHARADWQVAGLPAALWMDADEVARAGVAGLERNRALVVPGATNGLASWVSQSLPSSVTRRVAGAVVRRGGTARV